MCAQGRECLGAVGMGAWVYECARVDGGVTGAGVPCEMDGALRVVYVFRRLQDYIDDDSKMKSIVMKKEIGFDFPALKGMIHGYIRSLGWWRGLTISFPRANYQARIWSKNGLSAIWENPCGKCLCYVSLIGCCIMNAMSGSSKQSSIKSFYRIDYHPLQVFAMIQPALWCPGFSGMRMAQELMRDMFW